MKSKLSPEKLQKWKEKQDKLTWDYPNVIPLETKVKIGISERRVRELHNEYSKEYVLKISSKVKLRVFKVYRKLKVSNLTLLDTTEKVISEGQRQHHCVGSYTKKISSGKCAIYTLIDKDKEWDYTVEIEYKDNKYHAVQVKGVNNSDPKQDAINYLEANNIIYTSNDLPW